MPPIEKHIADSLEQLAKQFPLLNNSDETGGFDARPYVADLLEKSLLQLLEIARGEVEKMHKEDIDMGAYAVETKKEYLSKQRVLDTLTITENK